MPCNRGLGPKHTTQLCFDMVAACSAINNKYFEPPDTPVTIWNHSSVEGRPLIIFTLFAGLDPGPGLNPPICTCAGAGVMTDPACAVGCARGGSRQNDICRGRVPVPHHTALSKSNKLCQDSPAGVGEFESTWCLT